MSGAGEVEGLVARGMVCEGLEDAPGVGGRWLPGKAGLVCLGLLDSKGIGPYMGIGLEMGIWTFGLGP